MAITDEQVTYSYLAQGLRGAPYTLRASMPQTIEFSPSSISPLLPTLTVSTLDKGLATSIHTWATLSDYYAWVNSQASYIFFRPSSHYGNIYSLELSGRGTGGIVDIIARDDNGNRVFDTSIAPPELAYYQNSRDGAPDYTEHPITLTLRGDIAHGTCYFSFASEFSDQRHQDYPATNNYYYDCDSGSTNNINLLRMMLDESIMPDEGGGAPTGDADGGGGLYDYPFGAIEVPNLPQYSVCDTGMIGLYNVTPSQMYQLSDKLWSQNFFDNIIKNFQSPMDNIISLHVVPFNIFGGTSQNIHIGNYDTEIPSNLLSSSYYEIDCGTINLTGAYKTFADYAPFTQISCYLPMIGVVDIPPDDIQNGAINIKYHIDVFSGACVAFISAYIRGQWTVVQQHQGDMITQYPVTGADYTNYFAGRIGALTKAVTAGALLASIPATGGATAPITGGMLAQLGAGSAVGVAGAGAMGAGAVTGAMTAKPQYQRTGSMTSAGGLMGVQTPYLIISKPNYIQASNFRQTKGYVSNLTCTIGDESGYLSATVNNAMLTGIECTDTEKQLIASALAEGVYV